MPTNIADTRVHQALTHLLADHSEYGALSLNLTYIADSSLPAAMATDGTRCWYNPTRLDARTDRNNQFTIAHETVHCALGHIWRAAALRAEGFTQQEINVAADLAANALLIDPHTHKAVIGDAPDGILYDPAYRNLSMEQIARLRRAQQQQQQQQQPPPPSTQPQPDDDDDDSQQQPQQGDDSTDDDTQGDDSSPSDSASQDDEQDSDGSPQDGNSSDAAGDADDSDDASGSAASKPGTAAGDDASQQLSDAPGAGAFDLLPPEDATPDAQPQPGDPKPMSEDDWQMATEQAFAVSKKAGAHDGNFERAVNAARTVDPSPWEVLRQFIEALAPSDYSWLRPNRRFVASGQYLPSLDRENMPALIFAIDTSGSVTQPMLDEFAAHITALAEEFHPRAIHVLYADTHVRHVETFEDGDEITLRAYGGGGTAFAPTFEHVNADEDGIYADAAALIYITDLQGDTNIAEPDYPVLWATPSYYRDPEPFGERIWLT